MTAHSGNKVQRSFCGNCGSPVATRTPKYPGKVAIKVILFDEIAAPTVEAFTHGGPWWQKAGDGAKQM